MPELPQKMVEEGMLELINYMRLKKKKTPTKTNPTQHCVPQESSRTFHLWSHQGCAGLSISGFPVIGEVARVIRVIKPEGMPNCGAPSDHEPRTVYYDG